MEQHLNLAAANEMDEDDYEGHLDDDEEEEDEEEEDEEMYH